MSLRWPLTAIVLVSCVTSALAGPAWRTLVGYDPLLDKTACLVESAPVIVNDGQTETSVRFLYNGEAFLAATGSNIDLSYPNVGLQVDANVPISIERIHKETNVVFANDAAQIQAQFVHGSKAQLSLGFWPTWPRGDTVVAEFSLTGFTRAHEDFTLCRQTGRVGESAEEGKRP